MSRSGGDECVIEGMEVVGIDGILLDADGCIESTSRAMADITMN